MEKEKFIEELTDLMDTEEELTMATVLADIEEWDSLSRVAYLAFCTRNGAKATPEAINVAETVQDLYDLLEAK